MSERRTQAGSLRGVGRSAVIGSVSTKAVWGA
jgi:hypothetical protein